MRVLRFEPLLITMLLLSPSARNVQADPLSDGTGAAPPETVERVDLRRYAGLWYEIAKLPNRFQKHCVRTATAEYRLRNDDRIDVVNRCITADGSPEQATGIARVVPGTGNARLEVSFVSFLGWRPFWGDYWILGLGEDYDWALVGEPTRRYAWILSRSPRIDDGTLQAILRLAVQQGYPRDAFEMTPQ